MATRALFICLVLTQLVYTLGFTSIDQTRYDEGKRQLELVEKNSQMPRYGKCWKNAIVELQVGCRKLTDVIQSRLALAYLNCFLGIQGRDTYPCEPNESIESCTKFLSDVDRNSFTTFFTHTQSICYFLQAQAWQEGTEQTIVDLSTQSRSLVSRLQEASSLQQEMNRKQSEALENQEEILAKAAEMNDVITSSSDSIEGMLVQFRNSTEEQRLLISDVFDKITKLHATVLEEFSGFYTMVYYTVAVIICYVFTSSDRTSAARPWMYVLMIINLLVERSCLEHVQDFITQYVHITESKDQAVLLYESCWLCRKIFAGISGLVLLVFMFRYRDINLINNQLLLEIRKQNVELKHYLQGTRDSSKSQSVSKLDKCPPRVVTVETSQADSTGYESGLQISDSDSEVTMTTGSKNTCTDQTYKAPDDADSSGSETSFSTALTGASSNTKVSRTSSKSRSLQRELRDLQNSTPFRELTGPLLNWARTGYYKQPLSARHLDDSDDSEYSDTEDRRMTRSRSRSPSQQQGPLSKRPGSISSLSPAQPSTSHHSDVSRGSQRTNSRQTLASDAAVMDYPGFSKPYALRASRMSSQGYAPVESESPRSFTRKVRRLEQLAIKNSRLVKRSILREEKLRKLSEDDL